MFGKDRMKRWTMKRFLCFSIGTASIIYAILLILVSIIMLTHMSHYNTTFFMIISTFNFLCAMLIFFSISHKNAFTAYIAYNIVVINYMVEAIEFLICLYNTTTSHSVQWYYNNFYWQRSVVLNYNMYYGIMEMVIHFFMFLIAYFVIQLVWSFYRILQVGGNIFSFQRAEEIENILHGSNYYSYGTVANYKAY
ncbi:conserved Plasmodium membrane protein, unknown function [Plasmodium sp. gorilla clade G3]|nr:conserved Plasmodium membrane protein, unknown function [Plasmodium sp. gorilla clade G3]